MTESKAGWHSTSKYGGLPIVWTQTIRSIPQGTATLPGYRLLPATDPHAHTHQVTIRCPSSWLTNSSMPYLYMPFRSRMFPHPRLAALHPLLHHRHNKHKVPPNPPSNGARWSFHPHLPAQPTPALGLPTLNLATPPSQTSSSLSHRLQHATHSTSPSLPHATAPSRHCLMPSSKSVRMPPCTPPTSRHASAAPPSTRNRSPAARR